MSLENNKVYQLFNDNCLCYSNSFKNTFSFRIGNKKDTIINTDQSVLVEICSENKLEIGIGAILLLVGLSIYQILKNNLIH